MRVSELKNKTLMNSSMDGLNRGMEGTGKHNEFEIDHWKLSHQSNKQNKTKQSLRDLWDCS